MPSGDILKSLEIGFQASYNIAIKRSEYDQIMPQSQIPDPRMAPRERDTKNCRRRFYIEWSPLVDKLPSVRNVRTEGGLINEGRLV